MCKIHPLIVNAKMSQPTTSDQDDATTTLQQENTAPPAPPQRPNLNVFNLPQGEEPFVWRFGKLELAVYKYFFDMYKATFGTLDDTFAQTEYYAASSNNSFWQRCWYPFVDLFWCLRPSKVAKFFVESGLVHLMALVIMQLQIISLVLLPNLSWDKRMW